MTRMMPEASCVASNVTLVCGEVERGEEEWEGSPRRAVGGSRSAATHRGERLQGERERGHASTISPRRRQLRRWGGESGGQGRGVRARRRSESNETKRAALLPRTFRMAGSRSVEPDTGHELCMNRM